MTINDQHRAATGTPNGSGPDHEPLSGTHALVDRLHSGEPYAVAFGGHHTAEQQASRRGGRGRLVKVRLNLA